MKSGMEIATEIWDERSNWNKQVMEGETVNEWPRYAGSTWNKIWVGGIY